MSTPGRWLTWYHKKTGKTPANWEEIRPLYHEEFFRLNPPQRKFRDLVREFADSKGGIVAEYLRSFYPEFWGLPSGLNRAPLPDISEEEQREILKLMFETVMPQWKASPEYRPPPRTPHLRFPDPSA